MFTASNLIGGLIFSGIGFVAFVYGKKMALWRPMVLGILLMGYPYFVSDTWVMYGIGVLLTAGLYVFRD